MSIVQSIRMISPTYLHVSIGQKQKTTHEKPCLKTTGPRPKTNYRLQVHRNIKKVLSNRFAFKLSESSSSSIFYLFSRLNSDHGVEYRNQICLKDRSFIRIINLQIWLEYSPPKQNLLLIVILMFWLAEEFVDCYIVLPYQALNYRNRIIFCNISARSFCYRT